ncbi:hypothetical protein [Microbacterium sp.]|uniref:hypothetical protein n=1 Tax=Microbacterium sp. TaxID=51671 RepID=UPI0039E5C943
MTPGDDLDDWLHGLDEDDLRQLVLAGAGRSPEFADWLETVRVAASDDPGDLLRLVNDNLTPSYRFYDYRQANDYADDAYDTVQLLAARAESATPQLIPVIERALTLATRAILKSDDSSGRQGDLAYTLLAAHATAVRTSQPPLTQAEQTKLVAWIVKFRYGGQQDFFDPDIVAYAPGLSAKSIAKYREAIAGIDLGPYGRYPLTRLAVLDKDRDAIVAAHGGEPTNALLAAAIVWDLEEAGLHDDAVAYAHIGIAMDGRGWDRKLITFLVDDALDRGASDEAVTLRREWFRRHPSTASFDDLRTTASNVGQWAAEQDAAEALLAERHPDSYVQHLLKTGRGDAAWAFATTNRERLADASTWLNLCADRARTRPADTLPLYRQIVTDTLTVTDVRNYKSAARILVTMRGAADAAGPEHRAAFDAFLLQTAEDNRRRPRCLDEFARAKLIGRR